MIESKKDRTDRIPHRVGTCSVKPLKQPMFKALLKQWGVVRLPYDRGNSFFDMEQASREPAWQTPSPVDLREIEGVDAKDTLEGAVNEVDSTAGAEASLNVPVVRNHPGDSVLSENERTAVPALVPQTYESQKNMWAALESLPEREQHIIEMHYGLDGGEGFAFAAIGREMGIPRQQVQQLENKAVGCLRRHLEVRSGEIRTEGTPAARNRPYAEGPYECERDTDYLPGKA